MLVPQREEVTVTQGRVPPASDSDSQPGFPPARFVLVTFLYDFIFQGWKLWPGPQKLLKLCAAFGAATANVDWLGDGTQCLVNTR